MKYIKGLLTLDIICGISLGIALIACIFTGYSPEVTGTIVGAIGGAIGGKALASHSEPKEPASTIENFPDKVKEIAKETATNVVTNAIDKAIKQGINKL